MRLIDADALERHVYTEWANGELSNSEWIDFRQWLKDEPTVEPSSPWHRVDDEEPTKAGWYLVMDEDGDFNVDEWHNTFGWQFVTPSDADRITHWMPIEPPKEEEHGN